MDSKHKKGRKHEPLHEWSHCRRDDADHPFTMAHEIAALCRQNRLYKKERKDHRKNRHENLFRNGARRQCVLQCERADRNRDSRSEHDSTTVPMQRSVAVTKTRPKLERQKNHKCKTAGKMYQTPNRVIEKPAELVS